MKLWIIGGTSESVRIIKSVDYRAIVVSVAGKEGRDRLPEDADVHVGPMDRDAMVDFIREKNIVAVVDMSHPSRRSSPKRRRRRRMKRASTTTALSGPWRMRLGTWSSTITLPAPST